MTLKLHYTSCIGTSSPRELADNWQDIHEQIIIYRPQICAWYMFHVDEDFTRIVFSDRSFYGVLLSGDDVMCHI